MENNPGQSPTAPSNPKGSLEAFVWALPKTETHLHIEGALPYDLMRALDPVRYPDNPPFRRKLHRYQTFPEFEQVLLDHATVWYTSPERYFEAARIIFADHVRNNVRYVETSFHLHMTEYLGIPAREILAAIRAAVPPGLEVRVFAGMFRNAYHGRLHDTIESLHEWDELAGVDLHGIETMPTESWSIGIWKRMRDAGKVTKCHAGEFDGPNRVREAIEMLGVLRVQHGVRAIEDPEVMRLAVEKRATFDVCPLSNVGLKVYPDLASHPLRRLMQAGINCTVSTDDPLSFANSVIDEYLALANDGGFTRAELAQIARNGWKVASVPADVRDRNLAEIDRVASL